MERDAASVIRSVLAGSLPVVDGCRLLVRFQELELLSRADFLTLVGFESETEHLPWAHVDRDRFDPAYLRRIEEESAPYLLIMTPRIRLAMENLLRKLES